MTPRSKLWRVAAAVFTFINVGGAGFAAANGEWLHAAGHVALLLGGYVVWQYAFRGRQQNAPDAQLPDERLEYLQQSVDAIALEVERIGEAQRFHEKLMTERNENSPPDRPEPR
jgi:hypothetical protein